MWLETFVLTSVHEANREQLTSGNSRLRIMELHESTKEVLVAADHNHCSSYSYAGGVVVGT